MIRIEFDPPVDPGINCRNCGHPLVAVAEIQDGLVWDACREYEWRHRVGLDLCPPVHRVAQVPDAFKATAAVEAALAGRRAADDALNAALETETETQP